MKKEGQRDRRGGHRVASRKDHRPKFLIDLGLTRRARGAADSFTLRNARRPWITISLEFCSTSWLSAVGCEVGYGQWDVG